MRLAVSIVIIVFSAIVVLITVGLLVLEMIGKVKHWRENAPSWLAPYFEKRSSQVILLLVCAVLLAGDGLELLMKEVPATVTLRTPGSTGIQFAEREFRRDDPKLPYGLEVTIEPTQEVEPVGVLVPCDGEIGYWSARLKNGENFSQMAQGLLTNHPDVFVMKWKAPAWKPGTPLVVQLYSETPIHVKAAERVHYYWP